MFDFNFHSRRYSEGVGVFARERAARRDELEGWAADRERGGGAGGRA